MGSGKWSIDDPLTLVDLKDKEQHSGQWGITLDVYSEERYVLNVS